MIFDIHLFSSHRERRLPFQIRGLKNSSPIWPRIAARPPIHKKITDTRNRRIYPLAFAGTASHRRIGHKLQRDDFRSYLRYLGRNNLSRAATSLRFSALRTFYKFLIRHGAACQLRR